MGGVPFWSTDTATMGTALSLQGANGPTIIGGNQIYMRNPKDTLIFAGQQFPGICKLMPGNVVQLLMQRRKGPDVNGARLAILGTDPKDFDVICKIWTGLQWKAFQDLLAKIWQPPTKKTKLSEAAAEIRHPILQALKVTQAALEGVFYAGEGPEPQSEMFRFHFQWSVLPTAAPVKKVVKGAALGLTQKLPQLNAPQNATPAPPWTDPKTSSLSGQPAQSGGG